MSELEIVLEYLPITLRKEIISNIGTEPNPERAEHWRSMCFEQNYKELVNEMEELLGINIK